MCIYSTKKIDNSGILNFHITDQQCQQLSAPSNGHVTYSNISRVYNSVATYSCDQGYELHGVKYRYCQSVNGTSQFEWTGIAPLCKGK